MLRRLNISNFTVFKAATLDFSPGINVFIGANSTGKTHVLKLLYCFTKTLKDQKGPSKRAISYSDLVIKMVGVFRPDNQQLNRLVRHTKDKGDTRIEVGFFNETFGLIFARRGMRQFSVSGPRSRSSLPASLFLPAREVLSIFPGFLSAYADRELAFDETYRDLCLALDRLPLRGPRGKEAASLWQPLAAVLKAKIKREGSRFYLVSESDGKVEAHLVAEGSRKIASLMHLIANGSIARGGILFWDEPEANLNPKLIKVVADFLLNLAAHGVQVFLATHDYLLTNELSLQAEYRTKASIDASIRFFAFSRDPENGVSVQSGEMLADLDHNPIMDEFEAHYEREQKLFYARIEGPTP